MSVDKKRFPFGLIVGVAVAVVAAGGAVAWWAFRSLDPTPTTAPTPTTTAPTAPPSTTSQPDPQTAEPPTTQAPIEASVEVYWLNQTGELELLSSPVTLQKASSPDVMEKAFETLLAGPQEQTYTTAIPEGTKLLNVDAQPDGVYVDLSQEFTSGGGSASMMGRLGQVVYTATSSAPEGEVWISVEGEPLEVLGGEGLIVDQPMTRQIFEENFAF